MEGKLIEFITPTHFSLFGHLVAVLYFFSGAIFLGIVTQLRSIEFRNFVCDVPDSLKNEATDLNGQCFLNYNQQFNPHLHLNVFVLLSFFSSVVVCITYTCCVRRIVKRMEADYIPTMDDPKQNRILSRTVFLSYFGQLLVRFVLGVSFVVLQKEYFFPSDFPTEFLCDTKSKTEANATDSNSTTSAPIDASRMNCHNIVALDNTVWAEVVWCVNIVFTVIGYLGEIICLPKRAKKFRSDSEFCQKYFFDVNKPLLPKFFTRTAKKRILNSTEIVEIEPLIAHHPGEQPKDRKLDDMYVDPIICTKPHVKPHVKPQGSLPINKPEGLFLPNKDASDPRKILIIGGPGVGKSLLCNKIMRDWAEDEMFREHKKKRFQKVFLFKFKWFNAEATEKQCLKDLLGGATCSDGKDVQYALENPEKVLLVFDGLDEFKYHESCLADEKAERKSGSTDVMRTSALYVKLVQGKLLPGATVVTTCRPNVVGSLAGLKFDRTVETTGFTRGTVHEYVKKFFKDDPDATEKAKRDSEAMSRAISEHIKSDFNLLSLCDIPATCYIVCNILQSIIQLQRDQQSSRTIVLPTTLTRVYQLFLTMFIWKHHPEYRDKELTMKDLSLNARFSDPVEENLITLGRLARKGTDESGREIFGEDEVKGMEDCGLLLRMPDTVTKPFAVEEHFCFIHSTLQAFLAARHIVKMDIFKLSHFIFSHAADSKWHLVIQFVAGLLRDKQNNAKVVNTIVNCLRDSLTSNREKKMAFLMIKCLYELNDDVVARLQQESDTFVNTVNFASFKLTAVDYTALVYFLKHLEQLQELNLQFNSSVGDGGYKEIAKLLREGGPERLILSSCKITAEGVSDLCEALKDQRCKLTKLDLSLNPITKEGEGVSNLCEAHVLNKLTELNLTCNDMEGISHICEALKRQHYKLTVLKLSFSTITDEGVSDLCKAAAHENFKLIQLTFNVCKLTSQGQQDLQNAFSNITRCKLSF